ncbi:MAG: NAD(P)-dependent oxidoreductase [Patescibacteria group bacterium]
MDIADFPDNEYPKKVQMAKADIRDAKKVNQLMKGIDVVVHAAAALPLRPAEEIMDVNVNGTENLLKQALKNKVKKFIYISSTAVYGVPKKHPVYETDPMVGVGPYGHSKIQAEQKCMKYRDKGLFVTVIRPKTFLGPHRLGVFEILFDWIKDGKKIPVVGAGKNRYQLLDVGDLVDAIYLFSTAKSIKKYNDVFNIGAEKFKTIKQDMQELFRYAKSGSKIMPTPAFPVKKALWLFEKLKLSPLYQWVYDTMDKDSFVSVEKITQTLNWHPESSNGQALIRAYKWYQDNYQEIKSRPAGTTHTVGWKQGILGVIKRFL